MTVSEYEQFGYQTAPAGGITKKPQEQPARVATAVREATGMSPTTVEIEIRDESGPPLTAVIPVKVKKTMNGHTAAEMEPKDYDPLRWLAGVFFLCSFAGLAAMYRSGNRPKISQIAAAAATSGFLGLAINMYAMENFPNARLTSLAISLLAGVGGVALIDFVLSAFRIWGVGFLKTHFGIEIKDAE